MKTKGKVFATILLGLALLVAFPTAVLAGGPPVPFSATGSIASIDEGNVIPAGDSGRWVVKDRAISGAFGGPDLWGPYSFSYGSNVPIVTQSGSFHGTLSAGDYEANVLGKSELVGYGLAFLNPLDPASLVPFVVVSTEGKMTFTKGTQGVGTFSALIWAQIDSQGHIIDVLPAGLPCVFADGSLGSTGPSYVAVSGQWQP